MRTLDSLVVTSRALVVEALLLRTAEERAKGYDDAQSARIRLLSSAADARVRAARKLSAPALDPVVARLLRDAIALRLEAARAAGVTSTARDERENALIDEAVSREDLAFYDALPPTELGPMISSLRRAESAARKGVESRSLRFIRGTRFGRVTALGVAVAWLATSLVAWWIAPPNVAHHGALLIRGTAHAPEQFVDGVRESLMPAFVTGDDASVTIDLAGPFAIASVRVYNREDGSYDVSLPLDLETSLDGVHWTLEEHRRDHFSVWKRSLHGARARYVRIRSESRLVALNEIEVYGRFSR